MMEGEMLGDPRSMTTLAFGAAPPEMKRAG